MGMGMGMGMFGETHGRDRREKTRLNAQLGGTRLTMLPHQGVAADKIRKTPVPGNLVPGLMHQLLPATHAWNPSSKQLTGLKIPSIIAVSFCQQFKHNPPPTTAPPTVNLARHNWQRDLLDT